MEKNYTSVTFINLSMGSLGIIGKDSIEMVKWGFWHKLPLLPLLWHANAIDEN